MEYTRVEASVKRYMKTSKMKKVAKARRALFLLATLADILLCGFLLLCVCVKRNAGEAKRTKELRMHGTAIKSIQN